MPWARKIPLSRLEQEHAGLDHGSVLHGRDRLCYELDRGADAVLSRPVQRPAVQAAGDAGEVPAPTPAADPGADGRRDRLAGGRPPPLRTDGGAGGGRPEPPAWD